MTEKITISLCRDLLQYTVLPSLGLSSINAKLIDMFLLNLAGFKVYEMCNSIVIGFNLMTIINQLSLLRGCVDLSEFLYE